MKVLILGSGAREHTIAWIFSKSNRITGLFTAPGNAGTDELGENLPEIDILNIPHIIKICKEKKIDLVFVGPETPLSAGIVDELKNENISVIGPDKKAAMLESSKVFSKEFMLSNNIPTPEAEIFKVPDKFKKYIKSLNGYTVIKKNGLAAGKGVLESNNKDELLSFGNKILKTDTLLVEEFLTGYEISIFAITDGKNYILLPVCSDFKKEKDGDKGRNTGGMGSICPVPLVNSVLLDEIKETIIKPTFQGMAKEGLNYKGILYFGLMITNNGPRLLEYNVRFGDPETQVLLPLIKSDFGNLSEAVIQGTLSDFPLHLSEKSSIGIVIASGGYPGNYKKLIKVDPLPVFSEKDVILFHASTIRNRNNHVLTNGGRCFTVVGIDQNIIKAYVKAYEAAAKITFEGAWYRNDIGKKFFID